MNISAINPINFKAQHACLNEKIRNTNSRALTLVHTTFFFRYDDIDEFIIKKLKEKQMAQNKGLNILSAGCSFGEEVYSFALALDDLKKKPNIVGIDLSEKCIQEAKVGRYTLCIQERELLQKEFSLPRFKKPTTYQEQIKRRFNESFQCLNSQKGIFQKKRESFQNCSFKQGDILSLSQMFEPNSQDAILCRYVLYHLDKKDVKIFANQAYQVLAPGGLLCIEPNSYQDYQFDLIEAGFTQPYKNAPCIFKKPKTAPIRDLFNNKFNFNNI